MMIFYFLWPKAYHVILQHLRSVYHCLILNPLAHTPSSCHFHLPSQSTSPMFWKCTCWCCLQVSISSFRMPGLNTAVVPLTTKNCNQISVGPFTNCNFLCSTSWTVLQDGSSAADLNSDVFHTQIIDFARNVCVLERKYIYFLIHIKVLKLSWPYTDFRSFLFN